MPPRTGLDVFGGCWNGLLYSMSSLLALSFIEFLSFYSASKSGSLAQPSAAYRDIASIGIIGAYIVNRGSAAVYRQMPCGLYSQWKSAGSVKSGPSGGYVCSPAADSRGTGPANRLNYSRGGIHEAWPMFADIEETRNSLAASETRLLHLARIPEETLDSLLGALPIYRGYKCNRVL